MALTTVEVTAVSRNSGTRRIREDTQGHEQGANQVQEDTQGTAGIRKDTPLCRFGTVRPRVQIPGPRLFQTKVQPGRLERIAWLDRFQRRWWRGRDRPGFSQSPLNRLPQSL